MAMAKIFQRVLCDLLVLCNYYTEKNDVSDFVLEIACISNHTSVHPSRRSLWNIMNDREMNKSRPLFPKCFQATDLKGIGHYPLKVENCKMVVRIRCFGTGGKGLNGMRGTGESFSLTSVMMLNLKKNVWESCRPRR